jgi:hypothetical protein
MWVLAFRFMITVKKTKNQILREFRAASPDKTPTVCTLPPAWPLLLFDALAGVYFLLSAWAHTFSCMEERFSRLFWALEKVGMTAGMAPLLLLISRQQGPPVQ